jgi:hypothetical protein
LNGFASAHGDIAAIASMGRAASVKFVTATTKSLLQDRGMKYLRFSTALVALSIAVASAGVPTAPKAPQKLCIDNLACAPEQKPALQTAKKWHPGHYMMLYINDADRSQTLISRCNEIANEPAIVGIQFRLKWAAVEPQKDHYDWSKVDAALEACRQVGKRVMVQVVDRKFGATSVESARGMIPDYIIDTPSLGATYTTGGHAGHVVPNLWRQSVMDRVIAMGQAFAGRYDREAYFEAYAGEESIPGFGTTARPGDYSDTGWRVQLERWLSAMQVAWPHTTIVQYFNWLSGGDAQLTSFAQAISRTGAAFGGPDVFGSDVHTDGQKVFVGMLGGVDYRGTAPSVVSVQPPTLGGKCGFDGDNSPGEINAGMSVLKASHRLWIRNTCGDADGNWDTGILPYLRKNPLTDSQCPKSYALGCNTH